MPLVKSLLLGFLITLPFVALEWVTTSGFYSMEFPVVLFILMWLHGSLLVTILMSAIKDLQLKRKNKFKDPALLLKIAVLIFLALTWVNIVLDQLPCFLGMPNCD